MEVCSEDQPGYIIKMGKIFVARNIGDLRFVVRSSRSSLIPFVLPKHPNRRSQGGKSVDSLGTYRSFPWEYPP